MKLFLQTAELPTSKESVAGMESILRLASRSLSSVDFKFNICPMTNMHGMLVLCADPAFFPVYDDA